MIRCINWWFITFRMYCNTMKPNRYKFDGIKFDGINFTNISTNIIDCIDAIDIIANINSYTNIIIIIFPIVDGNYCIKF